MVLRRRNPCNECPFRKKSIPGWLGYWTVDKILNQVHDEAGLPCHKDVPKQIGLGDLDFYKRVHVCVGSLQHATQSAKSYRNAELSLFQRLVGKGIDVLNYIEFRQHHTSLAGNNGNGANSRKSRPLKNLEKSGRT